MISDLVAVVTYQSDWPRQFERERTLLNAALAADGAFALHHIGSTSVPGLAAKPIIDMLLETPSLDAVETDENALIALGYEAMGEFGIASRRYFRKTNAAGVRTHHLHAFARGSEHVLRHLAFRDYLRAHEGAMHAYAALKLSLAQQHPHNMEAYMDGKDSFVKEHEQHALVWARTPISAAY